MKYCKKTRLTHSKKEETPKGQVDVLTLRFTVIVLLLQLLS